MKLLSITLGCTVFVCQLFSQVDTLTLFEFEEPSPTEKITVFGNHYLNGDMSQHSLNPHPSTINNSPQVLKYTKSINAHYQAGVSVDLSNQNIPAGVFEVCFDYLSKDGGQCHLELEASEKVDYLQVIPQYTTPGEWQTLCQIFNYKTIHPPVKGQSSAGRYSQLTFFPDYGKWGDGTEIDYYLDNIRMCFRTGEHKVSFRVNMRDYSAPFSTVYISGTFNMWSGNTHPLTDKDGDGIWETELLLKDESIEYLFTIDGWTDQESFTEDYPCLASTSDGQGGFYRNRYLEIEKETELETACFESCDNCLPSALLTWRINMSEEEVSADGVFLAGGAFGHGEHEMLDADGDGIYEISMRKPHGFSSHYTFINGLCPSGWGCKESLVDQNCGDADNYYDRFLDPVYGDREMNACFGYCSSSGFCEEEILYDVTFNFDDRDSLSLSNVFVAGNTLNSWNYRAHQLIRSDGNGIYSLTVQLPSGMHEYKFVRDKYWEDLDADDDCTITDPSGEYTNRFVEVIDQDVYLPHVLFDQCIGYSSVDEASEIEEELKPAVYPTMVTDYLYVDLEGDWSQEYVASIYNSSGTEMMSLSLRPGVHHALDVSQLSQGMYFVSLYNGEEIFSYRFFSQ